MWIVLRAKFIHLPDTVRRGSRSAAKGSGCQSKQAGLAVCLRGIENPGRADSIHPQLSLTPSLEQDRRAELAEAGAYNQLSVILTHCTQRTQLLEQA